MNTLAALGTFAALVTPLAAYIANIYRSRIAELEKALEEADKREARIIAIVLRSSQDEARISEELARLVSGEKRYE